MLNLNARLSVDSEASSGQDIANSIETAVAESHLLATRVSLSLYGSRMSAWSCSQRKRVFDFLCVLCALPLLIPVFLAVGLAVRLTSAGPVLFLQKRMGLRGQTFAIFKFRTMIHASDTAHRPVTTAGNQCFTPVGPFLRRWKLDELPQLLNVLLGQMSLVGPRPKMPAHEKVKFSCRPGITGAATIAFAREELVLDRLPTHHLDSYYHAVVLPAKRRLDADYMARATFFSDLELIFKSVFRCWDTSTMEGLLKTTALNADAKLQLSRAQVRESRPTNVAAIPKFDQSAIEEQVASLLTHSYCEWENGKAMPRLQ